MIEIWMGNGPAWIHISLWYGIFLTTFNLNNFMNQLFASLYSNSTETNTFIEYVWRIKKYFHIYLEFSRITLTFSWCCLAVNTPSFATNFGCSTNIVQYGIVLTKSRKPWAFKWCFFSYQTAKLKIFNFSFVSYSPNTKT